MRTLNNLQEEVGMLKEVLEVLQEGFSPTETRHAFVSVTKQK